MTDDRAQKVEMLSKLLAEGDEIGAVIRSHIMVENELIALAEHALPNPKALNRIGLDYSGRVQLALALGLDQSFQAPLTSLGSIRNKFAHQLNTSLTDLVVQEFYKTFDGSWKGIIQNAYMTTAKKMGWDPERKIGDLEPRDRFSLYAVNLWSALYSVTSHAKSHPDDLREEQG